MKQRRLLCFVLIGLCGLARGEGLQVAAEYEYLRYSDTGVANRAFAVIPGWRFPDDQLISRVELILEGNQDDRPDVNGTPYTETKAFVRVRRSGDILGTLGYYVRGGLGRSLNNVQNFNYVYMEPALENRFSEHWDGVLGYRQTNALGGIPGQRLGEVRIGPDWNFTKHQALEFRYVRGRGDVRETTWVIEYVYKQ